MQELQSELNLLGLWEDGDRLESIPGQQSQSFQLGRLWRPRAVVRVTNPAREIYGITGPAEAACLGAAAGAGFAPEFLHVDEHLLVTRYAGKEAILPGEADSSPKMLADVVRRVRELHESGLCFGRTFETVFGVRTLLGRLASAGMRPEGWDLCAVYLDAIDEALQGRIVARPCHNDLVSRHIRLGDKLRFIDWGIAAQNDPYWDLARLAIHLQLPQLHWNDIAMLYRGPKWEPCDSGHLLLQIARATLWNGVRYFLEASISSGDAAQAATEWGRTLIAQFLHWGDQNAIGSWIHEFNGAV